MDVRVSYEPARGCGFRRGGGYYLVSPGPGLVCSKLPIPLEVCPTCGAGYRHTRGWTWIDPNPIVKPEPHGDILHSAYCRLSKPFEGRHGLLWIGQSFYKTPETFLREASERGISRRLRGVPNDFKVGETWVFLAHISAIPPHPLDVDDTAHPGIFSCFLPRAVEYVVRGDETEEFLERVVKRGIEPVRVIPVEDQRVLTLDKAPEEVLV